MEKYLDILCVCTDHHALSIIQDATLDTHFSTHYTTTLQEAENIIDNQKPQIILCELAFAELFGAKLFKRIRETNPHALINILLYKKDKESIFKAMSYGIHNYLVFPLETEDCTHYINLCELIIKTRNKTTHEFVAENILHRQ
ncbi:MAG: response regulator [Bacteroidales bacterium]|nr:response regulator [Bacteroidales bacterium]